MKNGKPTIKEIAARTGVSIGTVHRAIYGKEGVGEETRKRILEEVERMNYHVDEAASILKRKELNIAVVLPKPEGEERFFFRGIWQGIREAAIDIEKYKIKFLYYESEFGMSQMERKLQEIYDNDLNEIDGLITLSDNKDSNEWIRRFSKQGVAVMLIASYGNAEDYRCSIKVNHEKAGRLAAEYLWDVCHMKAGKILVLTGNRNIFSNRRYGDAFISRMKEYDRTRDLICLDGFGGEEIKEQCCEVLKQEEVAGIFSCNARNTYTISKILEEIDRKDITLVGTDVFYELKPFFENGTLNASIYQFNKEQGRKAVEVMYKCLVSGVCEKNSEYLPIGLVMNSNSEYFMN